MPDGIAPLLDLDRLMADMRPRLHRYCARMMGSAFDGEDVLQEAMAHAVAAAPAAEPIARPEAWLFRIAHNAALDALRRRQRQARPRAGEDIDDVIDPAAAADSRVAATASLAAFMRLPPAQRSSVLLIDVLGHSLEETAAIIATSVAAVKAALHRARVNLRARANIDDTAIGPFDAAELARLRAYADLFNNRDFDALRDLLAEDVKLEMVNRTRLAGRAAVGMYFTRYGERHDWRASIGLAEARAALLIHDPADAARTVRSVILLGWEVSRIAVIRDFHYAPYVMASLATAAI